MDIKLSTYSISLLVEKMKLKDGLYRYTYIRETVYKIIDNYKLYKKCVQRFIMYSCPCVLVIVFLHVTVQIVCGVCYFACDYDFGTFVA